MKLSRMAFALPAMLAAMLLLETSALAQLATRLDYLTPLPERELARVPRPSFARPCR